jgi:hypothetical protein
VSYPLWSLVNRCIMARTRLRITDPFDNVFTHVDIHGNVDDTQTVHRFHTWEKCVDDLGITTDHPLALAKITVEGCTFDWQGTYHGVGSVGWDTPVPPVSGGLTAWLSSLTAQRVVASTAPLKPAVYNLTNIIEGIRDVPILLKNAGDLIMGRLPIRHVRLRDIPDGNLSILFAWLPLLQDLSKMLDFARLTDNRLKELGALNSGKTISKRIQLGTFSDSGYSAAYLVQSTHGVFIDPAINVSLSAKAWGTVRWKLADLRQLGHVPTWADAFRTLYGITFADVLIQTWKALPWSWLIDWFAHMSDALEVSKNLISFTPSRINIMWQVTTIANMQSKKPAPNRTFSGGTLTKVEKNRSCPPVGDAIGIHLNVPFFDTFKLSVLASLLTLNVKRLDRVTQY